MYADKIMAYVNTPSVKILTGVRRCRKSTLLKMIMEKAEKRAIMYRESGFCPTALTPWSTTVRPAKQIYDELKSRLYADGKTYLFLDEIQEVQGWEKVVNSLASDLDVDIYVTG